MPRLIKIESIAQDEPVEILTVDSGSLTIGREPENHIVVDSDSVSRQHGAILEAGGKWLFKDFESTNGTWINGVRLSPGQLKLLRDGDVLQLADFPMRINDMDSESPADTHPSVLVFYNGRFESELVFENPGEVFSIGGPDASFFLDGAPPEVSQLQITFDGSRLELSSGAGKEPILVHGMASSGITTLSDRDDIALGPYLLIICDTNSAVAVDMNLHKAGAGSSPAPGGGQAYDRPNVPAHLRKEQSDEWESEAARRRTLEGKKFVFGTQPDSMEVTSTLPSVGRMALGSSSGFEMSAAQRFARAAAEAENKGSSPLSENLLIVFGMFVFCAIIGLLAYFFFALS